MSMLVPKIGDIVIYRNRYGETDLPAIVTVTVATHVEVSPKPEHEANPPIAAPSSLLHVHLKVLSPGPNDYAELDVPGWEAVGLDVGRLDSGDLSVVPLRSWRWPEGRRNPMYADPEELIGWSHRLKPLA